MHTRLNKQAIRAAFGKAALRYDSVAHVQRQIADALLAKCSPVNGIALDAGCGTGYALPALRARSRATIALDLAAPMLHAAHTEGICGDIESLPLRSASIALYYSSLAWQWTDIDKAIAEAARVLQTNGILMVATLGPDTLQELRAAFRQADNAEHVRQFVAAEHYAPKLRAAGFESISVQRMPVCAYANDFRALLGDIKTLGAHTLGAQRPRGLFGKRALLRAQEHYESMRNASGLPVTYDAIIIHAQRTVSQS